MLHQLALDTPMSGYQDLSRGLSGHPSEALKTMDAKDECSDSMRQSSCFSFDKCRTHLVLPYVSNIWLQIDRHNEPPVSHVEGFGGSTRILGIRGEITRSLLSDFASSIIVAIRVAPQNGGSPELNIESDPFGPNQELIAADPAGPKLPPRNRAMRLGGSFFHV